MADCDKVFLPQSELCYLLITNTHEIDALSITFHLLLKIELMGPVAARFEPSTPEVMQVHKPKGPRCPACNIVFYSSEFFEVIVSMVQKQVLVCSKFVKTIGVIA